MGAKGYTIRNARDIQPILNLAIQDIKAGHTVVIDAKVSGESPIPVESLKLDPAKFPMETIQAFKKRYHAEELEPFSKFMAEEGLEEAGKATDLGGF